MRQDAIFSPFGPLARGLAQSGVRLANERAILTLVALSPGISNADLARHSGLGPQTTSRIVAELEDRGMLKRGSVLRGRRGQPATPYYINPEGGYAIGIEMGWRRCEVLLLDFVGNKLAHRRRHYEYPDACSMPGQLSADIAAIIEGMSVTQRSRLLGVGLAMPGQVERNIHQLGAPTEQAGLWRELKLAARLSETTGLEVQTINDGSAGCWAEMAKDTSSRRRGYVYLHVGTFIGAGIVIEGQLWQGPTGNAANLGSVVVCDSEGKLSLVHLVASILALERRLGQAERQPPTGDPVEWDWDSLEPVASQWLTAAGHALAQAIVSSQAIAEINHAIVDGDLPRPILLRLVGEIEKAISGLPELTADHPQVEIGGLGSSAAATGAAHRLAFNTHFSRAWNLLAT